MKKCFFGYNVFMEKEYRQIILGAGASGSMTAARLGGEEATLLIEGNGRPGAKIAISGGGRCNLTNAHVGVEDYLGDPAFILPALQGFDSAAVRKWFADRGVRTVRQKEEQYFAEEGAAAVVRALERASEKSKKCLGCRVREVIREKGLFVVRTDRGTFRSKRLVVATGGLSFPRLGASDIGYRIARQFGHEVTPLRPALVGWTLQPEQAFFKTLSGVATEVVIRVGEHAVRGRMLFAHRGVTGPAVLNASLYWEKGWVEVDLLPGFDLRSIRDSGKQVASLLPMPRRMARAFLEHLGLTDKPARRMRPADREMLERLRAYRLAPAGTFGYTRAEVTRGGVRTDEIDPETMESRRIPGLYFVGEVLDVTGRLGGYNFQWAFSSAAACARALSRGA